MGSFSKLSEAGRFFLIMAPTIILPALLWRRTGSKNTNMGKFRIWNDDADSFFGIYVDFADVPGLAQFLEMDFERS